MNNQKEQTSVWLEQVKNYFANTTCGHFEAKNRTTPIILTWEKVDAQTPHLAEKLKSLIPLLVEIYTRYEFEFVTKYPEMIANEWLLKPLLPLFEQGLDKVNWDLVKEKIRAILHDLFNSPTFITWFRPEDVHILVTAYDSKTQKLLGLAHIIVNQQHENGTVKVSFLCTSPENDELKKLLMSMILKLIPTTQRVIADVRSSNAALLDFFKQCGFTHYPNPLPHWVNVEYLAHISTILQRKAEELS